MNKMKSFLKERFDDLNNIYFDGELTVKSIVFKRGLIGDSHAGYSPDHDTIFISDKVFKMPIWVLDYLIMHEMTHLVTLNHSKWFWNKVREYKHTEWAMGYLHAHCLKFRLIDYLGEYFQWRIRSFWTFLELKIIGKTYYTIYD